MNTKKRKKKTWITYNYIFFFLSSIIQYKSKFDFQVTLHLTFSQLNLIKRRSGKENKGKFSLFFCYHIENYFFYFQFEPSKYSPGIFSKFYNSMEHFRLHFFIKKPLYICSDQTWNLHNHGIFSTNYIIIP